MNKLLKCVAAINFCMTTRKWDYSWTNCQNDWRR